MSSLCLRRSPSCLVDGVGEIFASFRDALAALATWMRGLLRPARPVHADLHVATGAVLLELLYADAEPTPEQRAYLARALGSELGLSRRARRAVLREAERTRRAKGILAAVRLVVETYSMPQRRQLVRIMHDLAHLDGVVTGKERYLLKRLEKLLRTDSTPTRTLDLTARAHVG